MCCQVCAARVPRHRSGNRSGPKHEGTLRWCETSTRFCSAAHQKSSHVPSQRPGIQALLDAEDPSASKLAILWILLVKWHTAWNSLQTHSAGCMGDIPTLFAWPPSLQVDFQDLSVWTYVVSQPKGRFGDVLRSEEGITANRKKGFFGLALNNWGRVGYYLIHNGSMHLLRTMSWHRWKKKRGGKILYNNGQCYLCFRALWGFFSLLIAQMSLLCNSDTTPVQKMQGCFTGCLGWGHQRCSETETAARGGTGAVPESSPTSCCRARRTVFQKQRFLSCNFKMFKIHFLLSSISRVLWFNIDRRQGETAACRAVLQVQ